MNQKRKNNYSIYIHKLPGTDFIFYVGQANNKYRPNSKYYRNKHWHNTVKKYGGFDVELLYENLTKEEADNLEVSLIKKFGRADLKEGPLVNMTNGGEGNTGLIFSDEHRNKISVASIKNQNWKYLQEYNSKRSSGEIKCSDEQRRKLSEARKSRI